MSVISVTIIVVGILFVREEILSHRVRKEMKEAVLQAKKREKEQHLRIQEYLPEGYRQDFSGYLEENNTKIANPEMQIEKEGKTAGKTVKTGKEKEKIQLGIAFLKRM